MFLIRGLGLEGRRGRLGLPAAGFPTSDDQVLQGGPGIGEIPLLACVAKRSRDPILVGQDLVVLEGSRH